MRPCPHCNTHEDGFFVNGIIGGPVPTYFDENGEYIEMNMDKTYWESQSKVIRCSHCGKIRRDVFLLDRVTIAEKKFLSL